jgi:aminoglycoside phosphotransferase (APT) family kinase protein/uncharacterized protein YhfF
VEDFHQALAAMLDQIVPGFETLESADRLTAGASQETWRLSIATREGDKCLCMRRNAGAVEAGDVTPRVEARLMQAALAEGIPAPAIYHILQPGDGLGEGFLMEWLDGETLGGRIVHSPRFAGIRPRLAYQCGETLARLHSIDLETSGLSSCLPSAKPEELVNVTWQQYREFDTAQPMLDYTARWLLENLPPAGEPSLVHGDFRNGNLMISPERGIIAVLDWELAGVGDPVRDLGWVCTNSWRFGRADLAVGGVGGIEDLLAGYRAVSGRNIDPQHLRFWMVFGSFWWSVCCLIMANSYRSGENPSLERPAIGRRASEGQADCVAMLIPGPLELPQAQAATENGLPTTDELLGSVANFLRQTLAETLDGADAYLARVAANSLDIASREAQLGPNCERVEARRLNVLLGDHEELPVQRQKLVQRLRDGMPLDTAGLAKHLRNTVMGQLAIDQPRYQVTPNQSIARLWELYLATLDDRKEAEARGYQAWYFCDNAEDADDCGRLVLAGKKRATASALWTCELERQPLPQVGDYSIVTNWAGEALCVIRTTSVETVPFNEVSQEFAATEGEGDGSLEWWRREHWAFYSRELAAWGKSPEPGMPILCEIFECLFIPGTGD